MKNNISSLTTLIRPKTLAAAFIVLLFSSGCVSKSAYEADIARLTAKLQMERADNAATVKALEIKLNERGKSIVELTDRYMVLQKERAQYQLPGLKRDLEVILKDLDELKLVVSANLKGSEGREMIMKIADMRKRVETILQRENNAVVPVPDTANTLK